MVRVINVYKRSSFIAGQFDNLEFSGNIRVFGSIVKLRRNNRRR